MIVRTDNYKATQPIIKLYTLEVLSGDCMTFRILWVVLIYVSKSDNI